MPKLFEVNNDCGNACAIGIGKALKTKNCKLKILKLGIFHINYWKGGNNINSKGAVILGEALKYNLTLRELNLGIFIF